MLLKLRSYVPRNIMVLLYKAFILPNLTYGLEVWGSMFPSYLNPIYITQKMRVRAITFSGFQEPSSPIFLNLGILDVYKLHILLVCVFIFDL